MKSYIDRAFQRLRGYCEKRIDCSCCRFVDESGNCILELTVPCDWKMPEEKDGDKSRSGMQKRVNNETLADGVIFRRASEMEG